MIEDGSGPREDPALEAETLAREEEPGGLGPGRAKPLEKKTGFLSAARSWPLGERAVRQSPAARGAAAPRWVSAAGDRGSGSRGGI